MDPARDTIFVYGTLMAGAGHSMHELLRSAATFVGPGRVRGKLLLIDFYPGLVDLARAEGFVHGEVWKLSDLNALQALDAYEGCSANDPAPHEFRRVWTQIELTETQTSIEAWTYVYTLPWSQYPVVESGDWLTGRRSSRP